MTEYRRIRKMVRAAIEIKNDEKQKKEKTPQEIASASAKDMLSVWSRERGKLTTYEVSNAYEEFFRLALVLILNNPQKAK